MDQTTKATILNDMDVLIDGEKSKYKAFLAKVNENDALSLVHVRLIEELTGFNVEFLNKTNINILTGYNNLKLKGKIIAIDEGHGGKDPGAVDFVDPLKGDTITTLEKVLNSKVGDKVIEELKKLGATVIVTREGDSTVSLKQRVDKANAAEADILVSIHFNAFRESAHGIETFKYRDTRNPVSHALAVNVHNNLIDYTGLYNRGVKKAGFYMIKYTNMPAILVELGFITNNKEEQIINTEEFQDKCAKAIVDGIVTTFEEA